MTTEKDRRLAVRLDELHRALDDFEAAAATVRRALTDALEQPHDRR